MLIALIAVSIVLAFAGHVIAGRLAGLSITALGSATMAFFLMPPLYSLRVSQTHDIVVLAFYGGAGLVLAKAAPSRKKRAFIRVDTVCDQTPRRALETDLSRAVADLMSSDLGGPLRALDFTVFGEALTLPCTQDQTLRMLSDVLTAALETPEVQRISVYLTHRPSVRRLMVTAHYVWPPSQCKVIRIGARDDECKPATFPGWPLESRASWFDNGYDRIYQVSVEAN